MMVTADTAPRMDPNYEPISRCFQENPERITDAYARTYSKLPHRDMGPEARYLGKEVPAVDRGLQDPIPAVDHELIDAGDTTALKR